MMTAAEGTAHQGPAGATGVTLGQWTWAFVPFGLGLVVALLLAEQTQDLRLFRTIYTVRLALLLAVPALALFPFRHRAPCVLNIWRLFWTFSFLAYLVHFAYAWFGVFGGQLATAHLYPAPYHVKEGATILDLIVAHQTAPVAYANLAVTVLWLLDVLLAWGAGKARGAVGWFHGLTWLAVIVSFLIASVYFFKNNTTYALGWFLAVAVALALLVRLFVGDRPGAGERVASA